MRHLLVGLRVAKLLHGRISQNASSLREWSAARSGTEHGRRDGHASGCSRAAKARGKLDGQPEGVGVAAAKGVGPLCACGRFLEVVPARPKWRDGVDDRIEWQAGWAFTACPVDATGQHSLTDPTAKVVSAIVSL